jgi:hypothetical protein
VSNVQSHHARKRLLKHAALAVMGWYLMVPPYGNVRAPLSRWYLVSSYDNAVDCEDARQGTVTQLRKHPQQQIPDRPQWRNGEWADLLESGRCVDGKDLPLRDKPEGA